MKFTAEAIRDLLAILPQYDRLTMYQRTLLTNFEGPQAYYSGWSFGHELPGLNEAGFVMRPSQGRVLLEPSRQEFVRLVKFLLRNRVFDHPGQILFDSYVNDCFTIPEREALQGNSSLFPKAAPEAAQPPPPRFESSRRKRTPERAPFLPALYHRVTSPDRLQEFLNAKDQSWEEPYRVAGEASLFTDPEVLRATQSIVRWLMDHDGRVILRDLPAPVGPELMSAPIYAGLRYALLFADIDSKTMEVTLGVWPSAVPEPVMDVPLPRNVVPEETFDPHFLLDDLTAVLMSIALDPPPLRMDDDELFAQKERDLARVLQPLPKWVDEAFDLDRELRASVAVSYLYSFELAEPVGEGYARKRLEVSDQGRAWLGLPAGDRLRVLVDGVLDRKQSVPAFARFSGAEIGATTDDFDIDTRVKPLPDIPAAMLRPFQDLGGNGFFPLEEIVEYGQMTNPLLEIYRQDPGAWFRADGTHLDRVDRKKLRKVWADELHAFVKSRLAPMGCVRVGRGKDGPSLAITPVGRYFLGQTKEWQTAAVGAQVIVQPNFDVTFLGDSPAAEIEIARFAERRGRTGVLLQITKKSIVAAAMKGLTAQQVLEILERVCTREVPANVRREIQGWFAQCRDVKLDSVQVIRCPDRETAARVMGLAKEMVTPLTETVLEYRQPNTKEGQKQYEALTKKLAEMGVRVLVRGQPEPVQQRMLKR